jgi:hypothetical protein
MERDSKTYSNKRSQAPSWTDRGEAPGCGRFGHASGSQSNRLPAVMYYSWPQRTDLRLLSYEGIDDMLGR